ncbi:MAG: FecR family protein, partial [Rhodanobacter sp.]
MRVFIKFIASIRRSGAALAIAVLLSAAGLAHAQSTTGDDSSDAPSRVARLSWISGGVGLLPAGATDWSDASINRPLTTGDKLSSGDDARAELELGGATVRLAHRTDLGLLDLNEQMAQIELTQGTLNLTVRHLDDGQSYEVDTPTVALVINQPGNFRVDIDGDATRVTALEGKATVYGENNAQREVFAGRSYRFVDSSLTNVAISDVGDSSSDSFGGWVDQREQRYSQYQSNQYVPDDMVGAQDLDQYGEWQDNTDYGAVWYPRNVAVDWAPYRDGHWAYIAPWGWTWIDSMQWGYAPYHYGRWAHTYRGWGWIPGPRY